MSSRSLRPGEASVFGTNPCPFTVTLHHQGTFVARTFFDRDGTPVQQLIRSAGFTETYSANGRSLTTISVAPTRLEATDGELTAIIGTGNQRHVIVPGIGPVLAQAGRFVIDPHHGQRHRRLRAQHPRRQRILRGAVPLTGEFAITAGQSGPHPRRWRAVSLCLLFIRLIAGALRAARAKRRPRTPASTPGARHRRPRHGWNRPPLVAQLHAGPARLGSPDRLARRAGCWAAAAPRAPRTRRPSCR